MKAGTKRVYALPLIPNHWVVFDEEGGYIVPAIFGGWAKRVSFRGYSEDILERLGYASSIPSFLGVGLPE